jgi:hypothetical protein
VEASNFCRGVREVRGCGDQRVMEGKIAVINHQPSSGMGEVGQLSK